MLMRENKGFFSFAFDSAHMKYGVRRGPYQGSAVTNVECRRLVPFLLFTLSLDIVIVVLLFNRMFRHLLRHIKMSWLCRVLCPCNKVVGKAI